MMPVVVPSRFVAVLAALALLAATATAEDPSPRQADEAQIRAAAQAYLDALSRGDGKACAALWTSDGDIVDDLGAVLHGRDTVALSAPVRAGAPRPEVRITDTRIRFLTADVAIEDGTIEVGPTGAALAGRFSATWVRQDGGWKLAALREARAAEPSGPAALGQLDWLVGDWEIERKAPTAEAPLAPSAASQPTVELSAKWNETKTYLVQEVRFSPPPGSAGPVLSIAQRIGWDPLSRSIRSWAFGSDGSHAEATWLRNGGSWIARATSIRPDGRQVAMINIYTYDGKDRCVCRSIPAHLDAEHAAPITFTLVRKPRSATTP